MTNPLLFAILVPTLNQSEPKKGVWAKMLTHRTIRERYFPVGEPPGVVMNLAIVYDERIYAGGLVESDTVTASG